MTVRSREEENRAGAVSPARPLSKEDQAPPGAFVERRALRDAELEPPDLDALERAWRTPPGVVGWLSSVDSKAIARRYLVTAFAFFLLAGVLAAAMRVQLARPENGLVGPELYNRIFTVHGTTMMFLFAVPIMEALGLYFVPLMLGTRNVAFPRLNAFGYYVYLIGGLVLWTAFLSGGGPDTGWFAYVPLSNSEYSPGKGVDVWAQTVTFTEIAAIVSAVEIIATTFKLRAPGMTLDRIPLFVWAMLVTSFMVLFAMPSVMLASSLLAMDRLVDTQFFNPAEGGDPILWQHLFWFFGHPEVYIIFVPATGIVSAVVVGLSRRRMFGYPAMVLSLIATGFLAFGLWVHHMFAAGLPQLGESFFTAASMMIAIPSGIQVFCWIATLWDGRPRLHTPMLFVLGFLTLFVAGGLSGVMIASVPFDLQVHDTYFIVAHFHYVLVGGAVFPLFAGLYYWLPKITGRMLGERAGRWHFWLFFAGFNLTFFPMHRLGFDGMPRRVYTYLPETGWGALNLVALSGALLMTAGTVVFAANFLASRRHGVHAGRDPWGADTLEWNTESPPPAYNFARLPVVAGRHALWEPGGVGAVTGLRAHEREVLVTDGLDARPVYVYGQPKPSIWPFLSALAVGATFVGVIFTPWALPIGSLLTGAMLVGWFWPKHDSPPSDTTIAPRTPEFRGGRDAR